MVVVLDEFHEEKAVMAAPVRALRALVAGIRNQSLSSIPASELARIDQSHIITDVLLLFTDICQSSLWLHGVDHTSVCGPVNIWSCQWDTSDIIPVSTEELYSSSSPLNGLMALSDDDLSYNIFCIFLLLAEKWKSLMHRKKRIKEREDVKLSL